MKQSSVKTYFIKTYGCQANEADSEKIAGWYQNRGFLPAKNITQADEIVINTCSVRQSAEDRVLGLINNLVNPKGKSKIILTGCMLRYPTKWLQERMSQVDEFKKISEFSLHKPYAIRHSPIHAWISIMEGCNNFCTYCVVPYARGKERSRPFEEIICEAEELVKRGYKEITLLGQNVNFYGKDLKKRKTFAELLRRLDKISGLKKIKFLTSNPWDLTEEIIQSIKLPKVDKYLHLPVQSGDDEVLKKMNRPYTAKQYLSLINQIKREIPEIKIGTDIIVGFPGETKKQFENTVKLCNEVGFEKAYIARYSPRSGTAAYKMPDDVPADEKKSRWWILEKLINKKSRN